MSDVTLDSNIFFDRAKKIFDAWEVSWPDICLALS